MVSDPIADFLTRIRNAILAKHRVVECPASNLKKGITKILFEKGYILNYKFIDDKASSRLLSSTIRRATYQLSSRSRGFLPRVSAATSVTARCRVSSTVSALQSSLLLRVS